MLEADLQDASQDGLTAVYAELKRDAQFAQLMGYLATVYGVTVRRVEAIDARSFNAAKEALLRFLARTTGYQKALSRNTRNGSWRRGSVHPQQQVQGRTDAGAVERLGGRGSGVRGGSPQAPPAGPPLRQGPRMKSRCPRCSAPNCKRVWNITGVGLVCPACVRTVTQKGVDP